MLLAAIGYPELNHPDFEWIQTIRVQYDVDNYNLIKPHFTFFFPCSDIDQNDLLNHVKKCAGGTESIPFKIGATKVNPDISGERWYLFLVPDEGYEKIVKIHDTLYTGILADRLRQDIPYVPHITIGVFNSEQECDKVSDKLDKEKLSIAGRILSIDVISLEKNKVETIAKFELISN